MITTLFIFKLPCNIHISTKKIYAGTDFLIKHVDNSNTVLRIGDKTLRKTIKYQITEINFNISSDFLRSGRLCARVFQYC